MYSEGDIPHPINIYGESKFRGEKLVKENSENFIIVRTNFYGKVGPLRLPFRLTFNYAIDWVGAVHVTYERADAGLAVPRDAFAPLGRGKS